MTLRVRTETPRGIMKCRFIAYAFFLLACESHTEIKVQLEVDGVEWTLIAAPEDDPLAVAHRFCGEHHLTGNA